MMDIHEICQIFRAQGMKAFITRGRLYVDSYRFVEVLPMEQGRMTFRGGFFMDCPAGITEARFNEAVSELREKMSPAAVSSRLLPEGDFWVQVAIEYAAEREALESQGELYVSMALKKIDEAEDWLEKVWAPIRIARMLRL